MTAKLPIKPAIDMDFGETALDYARTALNAPAMHLLKVFVGEYFAMSARQVQAVHGFELVVVPVCLLTARYAWAVQFGSEVFLTQGCD